MKTQNRVSMHRTDSSKAERWRPRRERFALKAAPPVGRLNRALGQRGDHASNARVRRHERARSCYSGAGRYASRSPR